MANLGNFDASQIDPSNNFDPVPAGEYLTVIVASEAREARSGKGRYLSLELEIVDGPYRGRKLWDNINLWHENPTVREIAQRTLSQICHAVGVLQPQDSAELHGKPLVAIVRVEDDKQYGPRNVIKGYKSAGGQAAQPAAPGIPPAQPQPAQPQAAAVPPWQAAPQGV